MPDNTVLVGCNFSGTLDLDAGPNSSNQTAVGLDDIFFEKYNSDGQYQWAKQIVNKYEQLSFAI